MKVVIDASVAIKWILPDADDATGNEKALDLLGALRAGVLEPVQPPHWLAEVAAVIARLRPALLEPAIDLLDAMEVPVIGGHEMYRRAGRMAADLGHHLFDTLYHAVALELGTNLVTADDHYWRKAHRLGRIVRLASWSPEDVTEPKRP